MDDLVRMWGNNPDGSPGLTLIGQLTAEDLIEYSPKANTFTLKLGHPVAKWLINADNAKSATLTIDKDGGAVRWSGRLEHYKIEKACVCSCPRCDGDGTVLRTKWYDHMNFLQYMLRPSQLEGLQ